MLIICVQCVYTLKPYKILNVTTRFITKRTRCSHCDADLQNIAQAHKVLQSRKFARPPCLYNIWYGIEITEVGGSLVMVFIQSSMKVRQLIKVIMEGETRADGRTDTIPLTCSSSWSKRRWLIRYKYLEMRNKLHAYTGDTTYRTGVIQSFVYLS